METMAQGFGGNALAYKQTCFELVAMYLHFHAYMYDFVHVGMYLNRVRARTAVLRAMISGTSLSRPLVEC
jgi:hypothetical protein